MSEARRAFFPYIDGLRAVSILAVVLFHLSAGLLPGGFAGVDVFFAVSGFVVSGSLHHYQITSFRKLAAFFYARRFRRIVPALLLVLLTTSLASTLFTPYAYLSSYTHKAGAAAFFGYSNIALARGVDYFSPLGEFNPFTHTWSLAVEEQFYLIFPPLLFLLRKRLVGWALWLIGGLCAASFAYGFVEPSLSINLGFYSSLARFWEIGAGVLLYMGLARFGLFEGGHRVENSIATYLGLALIGLAFAFAAKGAFPVPEAALPIAGALFVMIGLHGRKPTSRAARLLGSRPMLWLGGISYSLYLWHWPVFVLFRWTVGFNAPAHKLAALALALALANLSYYLVEQPLRRAPFLQPAKRAIPIALAAVVLAYLAANPILASNSALSFSVVRLNRPDWDPGLKIDAADADGCRIQRSETPLGRAMVTTVQRSGCDRPAARETLFVVGDSHAAAFGLMFDAFALRTGVKVVRYESPGCALLQAAPPLDVCREPIAAEVNAVAARVAPGDVVFLPGLRVPRFRDQWLDEDQDAAAYFARGAAAHDVVLAEALAHLDRLARPGVKVVLELPKPIFKIPLFRCSDWFNKNNPSCASGAELDRAYLESYRAPVLRFAEELGAKRPGLTLWDPFPLLCPTDTCSMWRGDKPLFFDGDHVSAYANRLLYDAFAEKMRRQGLGLEREAGAAPAL